jgi:hypothetical protein
MTIEDVTNAIAEYNTDKPYIVLYVKNYRVGSVEKSSQALTYFAKHFVLNKIQEDVTGTMHFNVLGVRKPHD